MELLFVFLIFIMFSPLIFRALEKKKKEREEMNNQIREIGNKLDIIIEQIEKDRK